MLLKMIIDRLEDVEESARPFYVQKGDKFELQVEGAKSQADIDRLNTSLTKERADHAKTKETLKTATATLTTFEGLDPEEVHAKLAEYDTLKASVGATPDAAKTAELIRAGVEAQLKTKTGPLEREIKNLKAAAESAVTENATLKTQITSRTIDDALRTAALNAKVNPAALDDFLAVGRANFEVAEDGKVISKDGIDPNAWVTDQKKARPHFWPVATGAGAQGAQGGDGNGGPNPFSAEGWNVTAQGKLVSTDRPAAENMAKAAGTTIGGPRPVPKAKAA